MEESSNEEFQRDCAVTLLDDIQGQLPKDWATNFKLSFIDAWEQAPKSDSSSIILKWDFAKKFYATSEISNKREEKYVKSMPHLYECISELKQIKNMDPLTIQTPNLKVLMWITIIMVLVFLSCYLVTMICYFLRFEHEFGRLFWISFIPLWLFGLVAGNFMANYC
jgi:hypothetical protein